MIVPLSLRRVREATVAHTRHIVETHTDWSGVESYASARAGAGQSPKARRSNRLGVGSEQLALARTIEGEIIPRLMLTHRLSAASDTHNHLAQHDFSEVPLNQSAATLAELALDQPLDVGVAYLQSMQLKGMTTDALFLDVIGPAARYLGDLWKADIRDFTDVTVALTRLQGMMGELTPTFEHQQEARFSTRSALLLPCPGEQHSLGLSMVQEFFRRAGWHVHCDTPRDMTELKDVVRAHRFDVVGFSASCEIFVETLKSAIELTRRHSKNRTVGILVGGNLFNCHPDLVATVGADATAANGYDAIQRIPALLGRSAAIC